MQQSLDFLSQSTEERLRHEAINILDSYAHPWDILAESLQNAVDAIDERAKQDSASPNIIRIEFDVKRRGISVTDSGTGMQPKIVEQVLTPHISNKRSSRSRGEKGIGLTFLVLSSNRFELETFDGKSTTALYVENAYDWLRGASESRPLAKPLPKSKERPLGKGQSYTRILIQGIPEREDVGNDIFNDFTLTRIVHTLRTMTAVGNTASLFAKNGAPKTDIQIFMTYTGTDGVLMPDIEIPYRYADPSTYLNSEEFMELSEFEKAKLKYPEKTRGKSFILRGEKYTKSGRKIKYFAFASSRKTYDSISEKHDLMTDSGGDVHGGIFVATRGMPTGISISPPKTAAAGYWHNYFIVLEDDDLRLDLGRKSLRGRTIEMMQGICRQEVWDKTVHYISEIIPQPSAGDMKGEEELQKIWKEARERSRLEIKGIGISRLPEYEQEDVVLFHEMVGAGILKGYRTYRSKYSDTYDEFVNYHIHADEIGKKAAQEYGKKVIDLDLILEFKHNAIDLLDDIEKSKKKHEHLTLLVCWKINDDEFMKQGVDVETVRAEDEFFIGTTHKLLFPSQFGSRSPKSVICLKDLVARYSK